MNVNRNTSSINEINSVNQPVTKNISSSITIDLTKKTSSSLSTDQKNSITTAIKNRLNEGKKGLQRLLARECVIPSQKLRLNFDHAVQLDKFLKTPSTTDKDLRATKLTFDMGEHKIDGIAIHGNAEAQEAFQEGNLEDHRFIYMLNPNAQLYEDRLSIGQELLEKVKQEAKDKGEDPNKIHLIMFNYRGAGASKGQITTLQDPIDDFQQMFQHFAEKGVKPEHTAIYGHSIGGLIGGHVAALNKKVSLVTTGTISSLPAAAKEFTPKLATELGKENRILKIFNNRLSGNIAKRVFKKLGFTQSNLSNVNDIANAGGKVTVIHHEFDKLVQKSALSSKVDKKQKNFEINGEIKVITSNQKATEVVKINTLISYCVGFKEHIEQPQRDLIIKDLSSAKNLEEFQTKFSKYEKFIYDRAKLKLIFNDKSSFKTDLSNDTQFIDFINNETSKVNKMAGKEMLKPISAEYLETEAEKLDYHNLEINKQTEIFENVVKSTAAAIFPPKA